MRIVVFSDSHNNYFALRNIVMAQTTAGAFLHLGDGEKEFDYLCTNFPFKLMRGVRGNCDWCSMSKTQDVITIAGKKIFFVHGHSFGVKSGLEDFKRAAKAENADIALFGHTHVAYTGYEDGIYYMNPGSVTCPQQGAASYGVIDITDAGIVTFIVEL